MKTNTSWKRVVIVVGLGVTLLGVAIHPAVVELVAARAMASSELSAGSTSGVAQANGSWSPTGNLNTARSAHTATLLPDGKVLVAGGSVLDGSSSPTGTAELYDPVTGTWRATGSLNAARAWHTATLLQNGQVLVVGGEAYQGFLNSAELYDPGTGMWRTTGSFNKIQGRFSATLLLNGKVLAVGGLGASLRAELYNSETEVWGTVTTPLDVGSHLALLPGGEVLAVSAWGVWDYGGGSSLYNPATEQWRYAGDVNLINNPITMTPLRNGKILVTGLSDFHDDQGQAAVYDPVTNKWSSGGKLPFGAFGISSGCGCETWRWTATLLTDGQVLVSGIDGTALYDATIGTWSLTSQPIFPRRYHTATLLPNGKTLIVGGRGGRNGAVSILQSAELYDPGTILGPSQTTTARGSWHSLAPMPSMRQEISTAILGNKVYAIAGFFSDGTSSVLVEAYDTLTNTWSSAAPLPIATNHNAAATVGNRIYAFGGTSNRCFSYNPDLNQWSEVASMSFLHGNTPAVAVIDGKIYVAGGDGPGMSQREVEVYNPATNQWTMLAPMNVARNHTAGGVINGKFYVAGGRPGAAAASALEVYDPQTNIWTVLPGMPTGRSGIAAAAVNGELYVFGGEIPQIFDAVEVFNPLSNSWTQLPPMPVAKHGIFASVINNTVYLPGGATVQGLGATNINQAYSVNTATTVSAASFSGTMIAERSIVAGFGSGLATLTASAAAQPLPTELGGTTVQIIDRLGVVRNAPLFYVSPEQVNYQIPATTAAGPVTIQVRASDGRISTGAFEVKLVAPTLFTLNLSGSGPAAARDAFTFAGPPFSATQMSGNPNILAFFGTGLGGDATDQDGNVASSTSATIDGNSVVVFYGGRAPGYTGLNQFNIGLPAGITPGTHQVVVFRAGQASNIVTIEIR